MRPSPKLAIVAGIAAVALALSPVAVHALAASSAPSAPDLLNQALGYADSSTHAKILAVQAARAASYDAKLGSCVTSAGIRLEGGRSNADQVTSMLPRGSASQRAIIVGCTDSARSVSFGSLDSLSKAFEDAKEAMYNDLAATPAVQRLGVAWRACMKHHGAPAAPVNLTPNQERASATCEAKYVNPTYYPLLAAAQRSFLAHNATLIAHLRSALVG